MQSWPTRTIELLSRIRSKRPMIHHLTNNVVTNFTANVTLCLGAAPVMAPCVREVEEMVAFAGALLLNIGTLDDALVASMIVAGRKANQLNLPVILDPVGAGATKLRTEAARSIIENVNLAVLRGNAGEVLTLVGAGGKVRGVDSLEGMGERNDQVKEFSRKAGFTVAVTGAVDFVTDGTRSFRIHNGHPRMGEVTGTGCSATTAVAAFLAIARETSTEPMAPVAAEACACALSAFGLAGELAAAKSAGPGTFVPHLLDALANLDAPTLQRGVRMEEET